MGKSIKVLIVEDTENDAALLIRALRRGGYDPVYEVVETPEAMSDALNRQEWDLVISDYSMPCFSGLDALKLLQDKDLDLSFILITGQVGEDVAVEAMKAGAHDYVLKSNPARLIPAVERELREAVMRRERRQAEKALQESEIRLRQITDNMLDMISLVDERGVFQYASPSHKNMLGYEPEFLIGKSILELSHLYHPDDVGRVLAEVNLHTKGQAVEYRLRHSEGHYHWVESVGNQFYDENCCLKGSVYSTRDITRRKLTEQALQRERDFSGAVLDTVGALVIVLDRKGRIIRFNRACESVTGYSFEEMQGKIIWDTFFALEDDKKSFKAIFKKLCSGKYPLDGENYWLTKKGNRRLIIWKNTVLLNETSEVEYIIGTGLDITEQRESENELALRAQLLDSANDSIVLHDFEGRCHYANEVACRFFGYTREEMMQKNVLDLNVLGSAEDQQLRLNELKTKGRAVFEAVNSRKDGTRIPIEVNGRVIDIGGKQFVLSVSRDITERKRAEERLKYLSFHDSFTGAYNRSYFDEELRRLDVERQLPISIIMGDVNGLKLVNDTFGHQVGDSLLATAAATLQGSCRSEDIICRWGGDEFAIILPHTGRKTANRICDRIRRKCEKASAGPVPLSFALGTATKEDKEQSTELVLKEAEDIMYRDKLLDSRSTRFSMITYFQRSLAERSAETMEHGRRIQDIVARIGDKLGLSRRKKEELDILAILHDIGQIAIPGDLLVKPCYLVENEWELIRRHPEIGEKIALSVPDLNNVAEAILSHHEYWNGMGYPRGLKGGQIPLLSRILAIADAYDVMTDGRPYKKAITRREAVKEIEKCAGTQFDPELVALFVEIFNI
jgi:diguanylate cyclase (GGDEF)-like protein/PAS domain S-box-containing protein